MKSIKKSNINKRKNHSSSNKRNLREHILGKDHFLIEGESAIIEFVKFSYHSLTTIICDDKIKSKMLKINELPNVTWYSKEKWDGENPEFTVSNPTCAIVKVTTLDESQLFEKIKDREKDLIIALDHITDPRNLGAIVRNCAFFGVENIVAPKDRQVTLTSASVSTSQGGFALVDLHLVTNLNRFVEDMKSRGYWIVGADMGGEPVEALKGFYDKVVLVLGAEGDGLSGQIRKKCDRIVSIKGKERAVESLNVSVAAGILINQLQI